jgi:hypothetical protein
MNGANSVKIASLGRGSLVKWLVALTKRSQVAKTQPIPSSVESERLSHLARTPLRRTGSSSRSGITGSRSQGLAHANLVDRGGAVAGRSAKAFGRLAKDTTVGIKLRQGPSAKGC